MADAPRTWRLLGPGGPYDADEETAEATGYRPCGICMRDEYARWKAS